MDRQMEYADKDEKKLDSRYETKSKREWDFANEIYIFSPNSKVGIMFYDQSPSGPVARLTGTLPVGKFWYDVYKTKHWDKIVNGEMERNLPLARDISIVTNVKEFMARRSESYGGESGSYYCITIMVSDETFIDVLAQLIDPVKNADGTHYVIDLKSDIYDKTTDIEQFRSNRNKK